MCALCISYLKHAATFRQQLIDNTLSLKVAQKFLLTKDVDEIFDSKIKKNIISSSTENKNDISLKRHKITTTTPLMLTENDLNFIQTRKTDSNDFLNNTLNNPKKIDEYKRKYLKRLGGGLEIGATSNGGGGGSENDDDNMNNLNRILLNSLDKENNCINRNNKSKKYYNNRNFYRNFSVDDDYDENDDFQNYSSSCDDEFYNIPKNNANEKTPIIKSKITTENDNIFNYKEKIFEEDDIMDLDELKDANIIINIPEDIKERKCKACYRRFMTEDSFMEHQNQCIELKFLLLIEEINRLLNIRRSKTISPHEFIRRMIFSLKRINQWLNTIDSSANTTTTTPTIDKLNDTTSNNSNNDPKKLLNVNDKDDKVMKINNQNNLTDLEKTKGAISKLSQNIHNSNEIKNHQKNDDNDNNILLKLLRKKIDNDENSKMYNATTAITTNIKSPSISSSSLLNNLLNHKEKSLNLSPIINLNPNNYELNDNDKITSIGKNNQQLLKLHHFQTISSPPIRFSAHCNTCDIIFNSVDSLEQHNLKYHNNKYHQNQNYNHCQANNGNKNNQNHKNIIDLFEDNSNNIEGTVDLMNILNLEYNSTNANNSPHSFI